MVKIGSHGTPEGIDDDVAVITMNHNNDGENDVFIITSLRINKVYITWDNTVYLIWSKRLNSMEKILNLGSFC